MKALLGGRLLGPGRCCLSQSRKSSMAGATGIPEAGTVPAARCRQHGPLLRPKAVRRPNLSRHAWGPGNGLYPGSSQIPFGTASPKPDPTTYSAPGDRAGDAGPQVASGSTPSSWPPTADPEPAADWGEYRSPGDWGEAEPQAYAGETPGVDSSTPGAGSMAGDSSPFGAPIEDTPPSFSASSPFPGDSEPWPFVEGFPGGFGPGQQNPYAPPPGGPADGRYTAGPVMPSDITLITPRDVDALLPLIPSSEQAGYYQPKTIQERVVQVLGSFGVSVALSKTAVLAGPALLYPVWGPWLRAGFRNVEMYLRHFKCVGLWRAEVLAIELVTIPYAAYASNPGRAPFGNPSPGDPVPVPGDMVYLTVGDPWSGGARVQLTFPYLPGCEDLVVGEPAELLVLSQDDSFTKFKVVREVYLPQTGMWLSEYPFIDREVFLDISLAIERSRQQLRQEQEGGAAPPPQPPPSSQSAVPHQQQRQQWQPPAAEGRWGAGTAPEAGFGGAGVGRGGYEPGFRAPGAGAYGYGFAGYGQGYPYGPVIDAAAVPAEEVREVENNGGQQWGGREEGGVSPGDIGVTSEYGSYSGATMGDTGVSAAGTGDDVGAGSSSTSNGYGSNNNRTDYGSDPYVSSRAPSASGSGSPVHADAIGSSRGSNESGTSSSSRDSSSSRGGGGGGGGSAPEGTRAPAVTTSSTSTTTISSNSSALYGPGGSATTSGAAASAPNGEGAGFTTGWGYGARQPHQQQAESLGAGSSSSSSNTNGFTMQQQGGVTSRPEAAAAGPGADPAGSSSSSSSRRSGYGVQQGWSVTDDIAAVAAGGGGDGWSGASTSQWDWPASPPPPAAAAAPSTRNSSSGEGYSNGSSSSRGFGYGSSNTYPPAAAKDSAVPSSAAVGGTGGGGGGVQGISGFGGGPGGLEGFGLGSDWETVWGKQQPGGSGGYGSWSGSSRSNTTSSSSYSSSSSRGQGFSTGQAVEGAWEGWAWPKQEGASDGDYVGGGEVAAGGPALPASLPPSSSSAAAAAEQGWSQPRGMSGSSGNVYPTPGVHNTSSSTASRGSTGNTTDPSSSNFGASGVAGEDGYGPLGSSSSSSSPTSSYRGKGGFANEGGWSGGSDSWCYGEPSSSAIHTRSSSSGSSSSSGTAGSSSSTLDGNVAGGSSGSGLQTNVAGNGSGSYYGGVSSSSSSSGSYGSMAGGTQRSAAALRGSADGVGRPVVVEGIVVDIPARRWGS